MLLPGCATRLGRTLPDIRKRLTSLHAGSLAACIDTRTCQSRIGSPTTNYDIPHYGCRLRNRPPGREYGPKWNGARNYPSC
jgi:hypothetical protein